MLQRQASLDCYFFCHRVRVNTPANLKQTPFGDYCSLILRTFGWKPEEVVTSDLVAGGFPADVGKGGVNLAIPFVAAVEYVYLGRQYTRMEHVYP